MIKRPSPIKNFLSLSADFRRTTIYAVSEKEPEPQKMLWIQFQASPVLRFCIYLAINILSKLSKTFLKASTLNSANHYILVLLQLKSRCSFYIFRKCWNDSLALKFWYDKNGIILRIARERPDYILHKQVFNILLIPKFYITLMNRVFGIPPKSLHISFGNLKIGSI